MPLKVCVRQRRWWWWCSFSFSAGFFLFAFLLFVYRFTSEPKLLPPSHCCADISRFLLFPSLKKYVITKDSKIGDSISSVVVVAPIPYNSFFVFFCDGQVFQSRRELRRALWRHRGTEWGGAVSCFMTETLWSVSVAPCCCYIALAAVYSALHLQGGRQSRKTRKGEKKIKMRGYSCRLFCSVTSSSGISQSLISK
jgi:hypothetical protein